MVRAIALVLGLLPAIALADVTGTATVTESNGET